MKSVRPLEGMTIGATIGGKIGIAIPIPIVGTVSGSVVGEAVGGINTLGQFFVPDDYDNIKDGFYDFYDKSTKVIGKGVSQGVNIVKQVCKDVQNVGKSIGKALSSVKLPEIKFGW